MRTPTTPGGYSATPGVVDQDDVPTRPEAIDRETLELVRLFGDMSALEKRKTVQLLKHWTRCGLGRRVLIEELARELAIGKEQ